MSSKNQKPSEMSIEKRLDGTPLQNAFLLLYSIIYESDYRFKQTPYTNAVDKENAKKKHDDLMNQCQIDNLFRSLKFNTPDECKKALITSTRFDVDDNGYITIK